MSNEKPNGIIAAKRVVKVSSSGSQIIEIELTPEAREMLTVRPRGEKQRT